MLRRQCGSDECVQGSSFGESQVLVQRVPYENVDEAEDVSVFRSTAKNLRFNQLVHCRVELGSVEGRKISQNAQRELAAESGC